MRAFLAIVPDQNLQRQLMAVIHGLQDQHGLKLTSQKKLHLTLHFFVDLKSEDVAPILTALNLVLKNNFPLSLQIGKKILLPNEAQASVLAYQVELTRDLQAMKNLIDEELLKFNYKDEHEVFLPHITIARSSDAGLLLGITLPELKTEFVVNGLVLFESNLQAGEFGYQILGGI